ncbi:MAG: UvrB/UvrC motif-containing protein [Verrucomicrobiales bacterium]
MKCEKCQMNEAMVFFTQIAEGKMEKSAWCESCAQAAGVNDPEGLHMLNLLADQLGVAEGKLQVEGEKDSCASCGFTLEDLQRIGRLGCPECYRSFRSVLAERIAGMHKGDRHEGRRPEGLTLSRRDEEWIAELRQRLARAIEDENYEEAARLRDEIESKSGAGAN